MSDETPKKKGIKRRWFILGGLAAAGGAAIGVGLMPYSRVGEQRKLAAKDGASVFNASLRIGADDSLTVIYPHADMGVGNGTALAQMLAEELDADWTKVRIERAPAETAFANTALGQAFLRGDTEIPGFLAGTAWLMTRRLAENMNLQITGGSTAIRFTGMEGMRMAGAHARYMLTHAAAKEWGVPTSELTIENGMLKHASGKQSGFGAFAEKALAFDPPTTLPLKDRAQYTLVGQSKPRFDIPAKVTGEAKYSGDVRMPGMVFAAIRMAPVPGGSLKSVDDTPAKALRGVVQVVKTPNAVAVLADSHWRAQAAVNALDPQWDDGANAAMDSGETLKAMETALSGDKLKKHYAEGDVEKVLVGDAVVERIYTAPYLSHAQMEPVGCVAQIKDGKLTVWGAFQDGLGAKAHAAKTSGLGMDNVTIQHTEMGGAFGRRGMSGMLNYMDQAILIAQQTDKPVNLTFSREEDIQQGFYRNASVARMRAVLGDDGKPVAIAHRFAEKHDPPDASYIPYKVANVAGHYAEGINVAPWGPWRSVDHSVHGFFIESFIDELAHEAKQDPVQYRLAMLADAPRFAECLKAVAQMSGWSAPRGDKTSALGVAIVKSFNTIVAEVVEVTRDGEGKPKVLNVWVAADPGLCVNPDGFAQQMESGVIYGLSAALMDEITIAKGRVQQSNFHDYPVLTMADSPAIHTRVLKSDGAVGGAGEPGTPPVAAALANAWFALTGERVRSLPMFKHVKPAAPRPA